MVKPKIGTTKETTGINPKPLNFCSSLPARGFCAPSADLSPCEARIEGPTARPPPAGIAARRVRDTPVCPVTRCSIQAVFSFSTSL